MRILLTWLRFSYGCRFYKLSVRLERFERPTSWFVGVSITKRIIIYQCLTSVRHTQKQSETATGTSSKRQSDTVFTTVLPTVLHRKSVTMPCTRALLLCQLNRLSLALPVCIHTFTIAQHLWLLNYHTMCLIVRLWLPNLCFNKIDTCTMRGTINAPCVQTYFLRPRLKA